MSSILNLILNTYKSICCKSTGAGVNNRSAKMSSQTIRISAPGKIILHGEHSVVYGTKAIAVSVGLLTTVTVTLSDSNEFNVQFEEIGMNSSFSLLTMKLLKTQLGPNFRYDNLVDDAQLQISPEAQAAINNFCEANVEFTEIDENLKVVQKLAFGALAFLYFAIFDEPVGLSITTETELPVGAGLGSSASFGVALAAGLLVAAGRISSEITTADLDLINRWAFVVEKFIHGTPSGVDNTVATFGAGVIFQKGHDVQLIPNFPDVRTLLVNTKVSRSTKVLVAKVAELKEKEPSIFQTCLDGIQDIVDLAVGEIKDGSKVCPDLVSKNHAYLKTLGVSHPSLEKIVDVALQHGFAAKLTGAGGGGCAFILIPSEVPEASVQTLKDELQKLDLQFWDTKLGCPGVFICK